MDPAAQQAAQQAANRRLNETILDLPSSMVRQKVKILSPQKVSLMH